MPSGCWGLRAKSGAHGPTIGTHDFWHLRRCRDGPHSTRGAVGTANAAPGEVSLPPHARAPAASLPANFRPESARRTAVGAYADQGRRSGAERLIRTGGFGCGQPYSSAQTCRDCDELSTLGQHLQPQRENHFVADKLRCRHRDQCSWYSGGAAPRLTRVRKGIALHPFPQPAHRELPCCSSCHYRLFFKGMSLPSVVWYTLNAVYALDPAATTIRASMTAIIH